ncbi:hypothetical protein CR513_54499, partial [Mucuna pruriens]
MLKKLLRKFNSFDVVLVRTPYDSSIHLKKNGGTNISQSEYVKIIGNVVYLINYNRPSIAYVVSSVSRYTYNPNNDHWNVLLCLLKISKGYYELNDANWVSDNYEINSTGGSTMESEFITFELASQEAK